MKLRIDRKVDAVYLRFADDKIIESEQIAPGVIVDSGSRNKVVGVEVLAVSERSAKRKDRGRSFVSVPVPTLLREKPSKKYKS